MTLIEVIVAAAVVAVIVIPLTRFVATILKGYVMVEVRSKNEDMMIRFLVDFERDLKEMNQVVSCSATSLSFYMDSHRSPRYNGNADPDGDSIPNRTDTDDDGDGFDFNRTAWDFRNFAALNPAISSTGWRQGSDLQDDDDDQDGLRDVRCNYWYDSAQQTVFRNFVYGYGNKGVSETTAPEVVISSVTALSFNPTGSPFIMDPNTGMAPPISDNNGNGILDASALELGIAPWDTFAKTRYITTIEYSITTKPNAKRPNTYTRRGSIKPVLLGIKVKYP